MPCLVYDTLPWRRTCGYYNILTARNGVDRCSLVWIQWGNFPRILECLMNCFGERRIRWCYVIHRISREQKVGRTLLPMTPSLGSKILLSTICPLYQLSSIISMITSSIAGLFSEVGTAHRLAFPLSWSESVDSDIFWEGFTGIWSRLAPRSNSTGSSVGGVASISLRQITLQ